MRGPSPTNWLLILNALYFGGVHRQVDWEREGFETISSNNLTALNV